MFFSFREYLVEMSRITNRYYFLYFVFCILYFVFCILYFVFLYFFLHVQCCVRVSASKFQVLIRSGSRDITCRWFTHFLAGPAHTIHGGSGSEAGYCCCAEESVASAADVRYLLTLLTRVRVSLRVTLYFVWVSVPPY